MSAAEELRAALIGYAPLVALVGQRVRFDVAHQDDDYPLLVLRQVGNEPTRGLDGSLHCRRESFQVESWGETRSQSAAVHTLVEEALDAADIPPEPADPDSLDPEVGARACVWNADIWTP